MAETVWLRAPDGREYHVEVGSEAELQLSASGAEPCADPMAPAKGKKTADEGDAPPGAYADFKGLKGLAAAKAMARERGVTLPAKAKLADVVAALEADDKAKAEAGGE